MLFSHYMDTQAIEIIDVNKPKRKPRGKKIRPREKPHKKALREGKMIGYMRVSTKEQDNALQYDALISHGVKSDDIFQDKISGSKINRDGLNKCLDQLVPGDVLIVWKVDRLGRSLTDLVDMMRKFAVMEVGFRSLTQQIDTTTPQGRMMLHILFIFAEFERETIKERVKSGIQAARDADPNLRWGRKPSVEYDEAEVVSLLKNNSVRAVAKLTGVPKSTIQLIRTRSKNAKNS